MYALDTTNKRPLPVNVVSLGNLQVDIVSMSGGGDATAANQAAAKAVLDNILVKNGEIETTADAILAKNTEIETTADAILAKNTEIETTADAILAKNTEIDTVLDNILIKNTEIDAAVDSLVTANHTDLSAINGELSKTTPSFTQSTLIDNAAIASGGDSSEIDMGDNRHLTLFGTSSVNGGQWVLVRKSASGGTKIPDGSKYISTSEVIPSSGTFSFAVTFENVGSRYLALRNSSSGSQTATVFSVLHR